MNIHHDFARSLAVTPPADKTPGLAAAFRMMQGGIDACRLPREPNSLKVGSTPEAYFADAGELVTGIGNEVCGFLRVQADHASRQHRDEGRAKFVTERIEALEAAFANLASEFEEEAAAQAALADHMSTEVIRLVRAR